MLIKETMVFYLHCLFFSIYVLLSTMTISSKYEKKLMRFRRGFVFDDSGDYLFNIALFCSVYTTQKDVTLN